MLLVSAHFPDVAWARRKPIHADLPRKPAVFLALIFDLPVSEKRSFPDINLPHPTKGAWTPSGYGCSLLTTDRDEHDYFSNIVYHF